MTIRGTLEKIETNNWGFTAIRVSGTRYGSDKKGVVSASVGDLVSFEAFEKPSTKGDGKSWPTFVFQSFKKEGSGGNGNAATGATPGVRTAQVSSSAGTRDTYWSDKAAEDAKKGPQIAFQAAYERAIRFTDLALRNGAFDALAKAKPTGRLEILQAFVDEQAERIMKAVYAAEVPKAEQAKAAKAVAEAVVEEPTEEETWS